MSGSKQINNWVGFASYAYNTAQVGGFGFTNSRHLRPVFLAAATTVLGVTPLLKDVFWVGLSVTIMAGLGLLLSR